jgi:spore germination cell wall hydrolase CwlJ-like protein
VLALFLITQEESRMKKLIILALLVSDVKAGEIQCIAEIMHAEAQGEPITGLIAIAEASVNRSKTQNKPVCRLQA